MSAPRLIREDGSVLEIPAEHSVLGRDAGCDVVVIDKSVSRRHALVERRGDTWWVIDQGSANGIFLGGLRVAEGPLVHGQEFSLGLVRFRVDAPAAALPVPEQGGTVLIPVSALGSLPPPPPPMSAPAMSEPEDDAASVLGLHRSASADEVRHRLAEMEADLGARIQSAPTPHLRSTYAASLDEARAAAALLAPARSASAGVSVSDLPSAQPVVGAHIVEDVRASARVAPAAAASRTSAPAGPPQSTMILALLTVILVGLTLFFWLSARASREALRELRTSSDTQKVVAENATLDNTRRLVAAGALQNGQVALCNSGATPIEIRWIGALWASETPGALRIEKFMSRDTRCVSDQAQLERVDVLVPGERKSTVTAGTCTWSGKALFVTIEYAMPGADTSRHLARAFGKGNYCIDLATGGASPVEALTR